MIIVFKKNLSILFLQHGYNVASVNKPVETREEAEHQGSSEVDVKPEISVWDSLLMSAAGITETNVSLAKSVVTSKQGLFSPNNNVIVNNLEVRHTFSGSVLGISFPTLLLYIAYYVYASFRCYFFSFGFYSNKSLINDHSIKIQTCKEITLLFCEILLDSFFAIPLKCFVVFVCQALFQ